jgi:DsbC/DsbD-like thiol-disulfide interchange protein
MTQKITLPLLCLSAIFFCACSQTEMSKQDGTKPDTTVATNNATPAETTAKAPPADVVRVETPSVEIKAGGSTEVVLKLTVASGYHINANPPSFSYLIPTSVQIQPSYDVTAGTPVYPASVTRKFAFSKDPLAVYEGEVTLKVPLHAESKAPKGEHKIGARVRVQPCDEEACYPPRTLETSISVTVK